MKRTRIEQERATPKRTVHETQPSPPPKGREKKTFPRKSNIAKKGDIGYAKTTGFLVGFTGGECLNWKRVKGRST